MLGRVYELDGRELPYRLFVPENYDPSTAYPLVLYLHHAGLAGADQNNDSGWDNCVQLTSEIGSGNDYGGVFIHQGVDEDGNRFDTQERYPHFLLAPHAETSNYGFGGGVDGSASGPEHFTRPLVSGIVDEVQIEFNIDPGRLYVTGISMGCYGAWDIIMRNPDVFAAASPQSCRGDPDVALLAALRDMPIWSMCGTNDSYFAGAQAMADGMGQIGATAFTFTAMDGVGHSINDRGYDYPGFVDWMFSQRRSDVPVPGSGGTAGVGAGGGASGGTAAGSGGFGGGAAAGGGDSTGGVGGQSEATGGGGSGGATAGMPAGGNGGQVVAPPAVDPSAGAPQSTSSPQGPGCTCCTHPGAPSTWGGILLGLCLAGLARRRSSIPERRMKTE